jgi:hypothetical protein
MKKSSFWVTFQPYARLRTTAAVFLHHKLKYKETTSDHEKISYLLI